MCLLDSPSVSQLCHTIRQRGGGKEGGRWVVERQGDRGKERESKGEGERYFFLSLLLFDLVELQKLNGAQVGNIHCSHPSCSELIEHIVSEMEKKLAAHFVQRELSLSVLLMLDGHTLFDKSVLTPYCHARTGNKKCQQHSPAFIRTNQVFHLPRWQLTFIQMPPVLGGSS